MVIKDDIRTGKSTKKTFSNSNKEHTFKSLCTILDSINASGDYSYLQHIADPYAAMLILGIKETVDLPDVLPNPAFYKDLKCEEVWNLLHEKNPSKLKTMMIRMDHMQQYYIKKIAAGVHPEEIDNKIFLKSLSQFRIFSFKEAYHTWLLQPDSEATAFSLINNHTHPGTNLKEPMRITPTAGRPLQFMYPTGNEYDIRFPCIIQEMPMGKRVQIHKELDEIRIFDDYGNQIQNDFIEEEMKKFNDDGVLDAYLCKLHSTDYLEVIDLLQLNDVWLHEHQLSDRYRFLWRFHPLRSVIEIARNKTEFDKIIESNNDGMFMCGYPKGLYLVRNLNTSYCPTNRSAWILIGENDVVQAKVRKTNGTSRFVLTSEDGARLFYFGTNRINKDEIGKIVDVNREGVVIRYRKDLAVAQSFDEIKKKWGIKSRKELLVEDGLWPQKTRWRKLD